MGRFVLAKTLALEAAFSIIVSIEQRPPLTIDTKSAAFQAALNQAGDELGLQDYYRSCVRPLFSLPVDHWPSCCGARCEPCMQVVVAVAYRVCELMGVDANGLG